MVLLDSNIIIYLRDPEVGEKIADQLNSLRLSTCNVVIAEVLGFKSIERTDAKYFEDLFAAMKNHIFDKEVTGRVIKLRRTVSIELPDAIIAATALSNDLILWTHNSEDFKNIPNLHLFDPLVV